MGTGGAIGQGARIAVAALLALALAAPAHAAGGFTPVFTPGFQVSQALMSADGTVVLTGTVTHPGGSHPAVQVRPPGGPLGAVQELSTSSGNPPEIAVNANGTFVAAWSEGSALKTAAMNAGATSFGEVVPIPAVAGWSLTNIGQIAVDGAGNALIPYGTINTGTSPPPVALRLGRRPVDTTTTAATTQVLEQHTPAPGAVSSYYAPTAVVDAAGDTAVTWERDDAASGPTNQNILAAVRPAAGAPSGAFTVTTPATGTTQGSPHTTVGGPTVAMSPGGAVGVLWYATTFPISGPATSTLKFLAGTTAAGISGAPEDPTASGNPWVSATNYSLGMLPDGRATVAYVGTINATNRAQAVVHNAGAGFGTGQTIVTPDDPAKSVTMAVNAAGERLLGIGTGNGPCAYFGSVAPAGAAFGAPAQLGADFVDGCIGVAVGLGPAADGVAAWTGRRGSPPAYLSEAAGLDLTPPALTGVSIPAAGTAGTALPFSSTATDVWGPVTTSWAFGDGTTADGAAPSHTFAAAGTPTVTVTATDGVGNAATQSGQVTVAAASGDGGGGGGPPDTVAPVLSALSLTRSTFAVAHAPTALLAATRRPKPRRGTTIRLALSENAGVRIDVLRVATGRRAGKRCVKPTHANRRARHCTRLLRMGTLARAGKQGANRFAFSGRLGTRALAPGHYRLRIAATDAAGNVSKRATLRLRIVRAAT